MRFNFVTTIFHRQEPVFGAFLEAWELQAELQGCLSQNDFAIETETDPKRLLVLQLVEHADFVVVVENVGDSRC